MILTLYSGMTGGTIGRDSLRSTSVRSNLYYRTNSCAYAGNGKAEMTNVAARTAAEMASEAFLKELNRDGCFTLTNGKYPEFSAPCAHEHTELKNAAAATCTAAGYTGDRYCTDCGTLLEGGKIIPATGHSYQNGTCTVCDAKDPSGSVPEQPWGNPFRDVKPSDWFYEGVKFANQHALFNGTAPDAFSPEAAMTRGMLVTVLWRLDGKTRAAKSGSFVDVPAKEYYAEAVAWAAENGIVNGTDATHFAPNDEVTREQIAAILYRYADKKGIDTSKRADLSVYPDANRVSSYAKEALAWANAAELIRGTSENGRDYLAPQASATRAQVATILARYAQSIVK